MGGYHVLHVLALTDLMVLGLIKPKRATCPLEKNGERKPRICWGNPGRGPIHEPSRDRRKTFQIGMSIGRNRNKSILCFR